MIKQLILAAALTSVCIPGNVSAQSRVFKEVSDDITSQVKVIMQDDALIGYVIFSKMEKISADSFSYKLNIMDENLNDIGNSSFNNTDLELQQVAFEKNVLCLSFLQNTFTKPKGKVKVPVAISTMPWWKIRPENEKENYYKYDPKNIKSFLYTQFMDINGTTINTSQVVVHPIYDSDGSLFSGRFNGTLKNDLRITTIPDKGFCLTYGDGLSEYPGIGFETTKHKDADPSDEKLLVYDLAGNKTWERTLPRDKSAGLAVINQEEYIYILRKNITKTLEGGYELITYNLNDSATCKQHKLVDNSGAQLKVLSFRKDLAANQPHITGMVIHKNYEKYILRVRDVSRHAYTGVFDLRLNKTELNSKYSYWADGALKGKISRKGYITGAKAYGYLNYSFDDFSGNTYYMGTAARRKTRWAGIGLSIVTLPLLVPPILFLGPGMHKTKFGDAIILQQNANGNLNYYASLSSNNSKFCINPTPLFSIKERVNKDFFAVNNEDNRSNYIILDDKNDIFIYDINTKKTVKTIPHRDGSVRTEVFKAKSGHIMIAERNKKEKSTRLSIEAL